MPKPECIPALSPDDLANEFSVPGLTQLAREIREAYPELSPAAVGRILRRPRDERERGEGAR